MTVTVGSLCTGYGGLELGLAQLVAVRLVWCADNDPAAVKLLAHHYTEVPNLGDLTAVDWSTVPRVDAITAGWPCQPWSLAGKQRGARDARAIWPAIAAAVRSVRPRYVFLENVASIAGAGELARACGDLAEAGYLGAWDCVRASDVDAPHRRERLFIAARADPGGQAGPVRDQPRRVDPLGEPGDGPGDGDGAAPYPDGADGPLRGRQRDHLTGARGATVRGGSPQHGGRGSAAADAAGERRREGWTEPAGVERGPDVALGRGAAAADPDGEPVGAQPLTLAGSGGPTVAHADGQAVADTDRDGRQGRPQRDSEPVGPGVEAPSGDDADRRVLDWAGYGPAIARWESQLGRPAPNPTLVGRRGGLQLNPEFVEWLMGLPAGHVTGVPGLTRNQRLKLLGNGVVPQQAAHAYAQLLPLLDELVAA